MPTLYQLFDALSFSEIS